MAIVSGVCGRLIPYSALSTVNSIPATRNPSLLQRPPSNGNIDHRRSQVEYKLDVYQSPMAAYAHPNNFLLSSTRDTRVSTFAERLLSSSIVVAQNGRATSSAQRHLFTPRRMRRTPATCGEKVARSGDRAAIVVRSAVSAGFASGRDSVQRPARLAVTEPGDSTRQQAVLGALSISSVRDRAAGGGGQ